jgi:NADH-quinone oxidoreductase subunit J
MIADLLFMMFAGILLLASLGVITARNPMYCVLFLMLCFINAAGLFLLVGAEFLALLLVMVYVGAVAVMFLFVVMTINVDFAKMREGYASYMPVGLLVGLVLMVELGMATFSGLFTGSAQLPLATLPVEAGTQNIVSLGNVLFTNYFLPFQMAGLILLIAMVGAIVLAHRRRNDVQRQNVAKQVGRKREEALKIVKVKSGKGATEHFVGRTADDS